MDNNSYSEAFENFIEQIQAEGINKLDGYEEDLLEKVSNEERNIVESIIYKLYIGGDTSVEQFIPQLKNYNGMKMLEENYSLHSIPSKRNADISYILWKETGEDKYIESIIEDYNIENELQRQGILWYLSQMGKNIKMKEFFRETSKKDTYDVNRFMAYYGYLYCDNVINAPDDYSDKEILKKARQFVYGDNRA